MLVGTPADPRRVAPGALAAVSATAPGMLRILMVSGSYPPDTLGGAEIQLRRLASALARRGHVVTVLTSRQRRATPAFEVDAGVNVRRFHVRHPPQKMGRRVASTVSWTARVLVAGRRLDFDVVHSNQAKYPAVVGAWISRRAGVPHVAKVGDSDEKFDLASLGRKRLVGPSLVRWLRDEVDVFVAISDAIAHDLAAFGVGGERIVRIPNGVEDPGPPLRRRVTRRDPSNAPLTVLYVGRLAAEKNVEALIEAAARVATRGHSIDVHVVGDGPLREDLERRATATAGPRFVFHGRVDDPTGHYRAADLLVLPSVAEGLSNVLLEAAVAGLPAVATPVGGNPEVVVDGETGYLTTGTDPGAIESALLRALDDGEGRWAEMSYEARRRTLDGFGLDVVASAYEDLYRRLISGSLGA